MLPSALLLLHADLRLPLRRVALGLFNLQGFFLVGGGNGEGLIGLGRFAVCDHLELRSLDVPVALRFRDGHRVGGHHHRGFPLRVTGLFLRLGFGLGHFDGGVAFGLRDGLLA